MDDEWLTFDRAPLIVAHGLIAISNFHSTEERSGARVSIENVVFIGGPYDRQVIGVDVCANQVVFPSLPKEQTVAFNRSACRDIVQMEQVIYQRVMLVNGLSAFVLSTLRMYHVVQRLLSFYGMPTEKSKVDAGTFADDCLQQAFVEGAKWQERIRSGAAMFHADQQRAEAEAVRRYGFPTLNNEGDASNAG